MGDLLVIDDDLDLTLLLRATLEACGHAVTVVHSASEMADRIQDQSFDVILIDLGLPDGDGKDTIRKIREVDDVPVIVVTSRHEVDERVAALDAGADDFVLKPFSIDELAARVRAQIRRATSSAVPTTVLAFDRLEIDLAAKRVCLDGKRVHFTPTELQMLILLARRATELVSHADLYREVWPVGSAESGHYVRVYIQQIRRKLGDDASEPTFIATEPSHGYRWLPPPLELLRSAS